MADPRVTLDLPPSDVPEQLESRRRTAAAVERAGWKLQEAEVFAESLRIPRRDWIAMLEGAVERARRTR